MGNQAQLAPVQLPPQNEQTIQTGLEGQTAAEAYQPWSASLRAAFRFCFVYFSVYTLSNQIIGGLVPVPVDFAGIGNYWPLAQLTQWTGKHVFRIGHPVVYTVSGSGDKTFDWVQNFCILMIALLAAGLWSVADRKRQEYVSLHKWFYLFMRFALGSELLIYGASKFIPLQMPFPPLFKLVQPYGNFSPMAVLWYSVGASPAYEVFTGSAELLGGILLIFPRTALLGALVALADMVQVFTLNMTYDVPVKLLSFHLILFSLFLLAPEISRLWTFLFTDLSTPPSQRAPLLGSAKANRIAVFAQIVFGLSLLGTIFYSEIGTWKTFGLGRPKPSLYGIWTVERMWIDNTERSPLLTDFGRWRRVIFDFPTNMQFQRMDDSFGGYRSTIDDKAKRISLTKGDDKNWKGEFAFVRPNQDELVLDGTLGGQKTKLQLKLVDRNKFTLVSRGFHWINEGPFQR